MRFRKKPVIIEAKQITDKSWAEVVGWMSEDIIEWCWDNKEKYIIIETLEGNIKASENDWIIKGVKGEFYPCKPDIFELTYEAV
jgi:hypothetical protein